MRKFTILWFEWAIKQAQNHQERSAWVVAAALPLHKEARGKPTTSTHAKKAYKPALSDDDLDRRATHTGDDDGGGDGAGGRAVESLDRGEQTTVEADKLHLLAAVETRLTSSLRHPKILIKEFSYFLMPCHQHGLRINLLV